MRLPTCFIAALMLLGLWPAEGAMRLFDGGERQVPQVEEETVGAMLPPIIEALEYTGRGELREDGYWNYQWDGAGRLVEMTRKQQTFVEKDVESETVEFVYDANGRRTQKTHTTAYLPEAGKAPRVEVSRVLWSKWLPLLEERTVNGVALGRRWFQWGADVSGTLEGAGGIGGLLAITEENAAGTAIKRTLFPVQDGLGNITAVLDSADGHTVARYEYGPFGEPLAEMGEAEACPFRFQTKFYDAESQHYYFGYRYYDPRLGRWLSRDPMGEAGGFNLYAYCGNDPVNRHDPLGLADEKSLWGDSWGLYEPSWWEKLAAVFVGREYVNAKRDRAMTEALGGRVMSPADASRAAMEAARAKYRWDEDHGIDISDAGYQERFREEINGGLKSQGMAAENGLAEAQPGFLALELGMAWIPIGVQFNAELRATRSIGATRALSKFDKIPPTGVPYLDELAVNSPHFPGFLRQVRELGFHPTSAKPGFPFQPGIRASFLPNGKFIYRRDAMTVLDMIHESEHLFQMRVRLQLPRSRRPLLFSEGNIMSMEQGAYSAERFILEQNGSVNPAYLEWLEGIDY